MLDNPEALARKRIVAELLHGKIVPDLVRLNGKANSGHSDLMSNGSTFEFHQSDVATLARHLVEGDSQKIEDLLVSYREMGCPAVPLILDLLSNTARELGQQWCGDVLSFADVTVGLAGLHRALNFLDRGLAGELPRIEEARSVLFVCPKGDTHIFGISVLSSFFRNAGWKVDVAMKSEEQDLMRLVSGSWFDLVGISISRLEDISTGKLLVSKLRDRSKNPSMRVLVGGSLILARKELVAKVGADATADNALHALEIAASICDQEASGESV